MWRSFSYVAPRTLDEALAALREPGSSALAGGTDFVVYLRSGLARPTQVVDLHDLPLAYIREEGEALAIGALTTFNDILASSLLQRETPALVEAAATIGATQCRNMATLAGNLCSAVPSADAAPPLLVRDALLRVVGPDGKRDVPINAFFTGPKQTCLAPGELVTEIRVPRRPPRSGEAFLKLGRRQAMTLAIVNVAAYLEVAEDGTVAAARIALGAVAPTPIRAPRAEELLIGKPFTEERAQAAARAAADATRPISDLRASAAYRRAVSAVLVYRALTAAWRRAVGEEAFQLPSHVVAVGGGLPRPPRRWAYVPDGPNEFLINGELMRVRARPGTLLVEVLRDHLGLTGTKVGCGTGECGACTVLLDGRPVNACLILAPQAVGREVVTIEGLGTPEELHPLQAAFVQHGALQCGYCGPGVLMAAKALLETVPAPTPAQARYAIAGNICRCTGYVKMVQAIVAAAQAQRVAQEVQP